MAVVKAAAAHNALPNGFAVSACASLLKSKARAGAELLARGPLPIRYAIRGAEN
jgi:hypothetical protein